MDAIKKNTVKADNQLKPVDYINFYNLGGKGKRIMFAGNSITLHGVLEEIGWSGNYGMAASSEDKDYVHLLMDKIKKDEPDAVFCVAQVSQWERSYKNGASTYHLFEQARAFGADIIICRFIENCPVDGFDSEAFTKEYPAIVDYLGCDNGAKAIFTTGFWKHAPGDPIIRAEAEKRGMPIVELGDLGDDDSMKAIGLFWHEGVANHPGDLGMKTIADRIYTSLKENEFV